MKGQGCHWRCSSARLLDGKGGLPAERHVREAAGGVVRIDGRRIRIPGDDEVDHIRRQRGIEIERLYEPPFTTVHAESVDGIFTAPGEVDEILTILSAFEPKKAVPSDPSPKSQQAS